MNVPQLSIDLVNQLRTWFYSKDRAIVISRSIQAYNVPNGATLAMALIEERVLTASTTNIVFNIPQNFRQIIIVPAIRTDRVDETDNILWRANGDSGANYDFQYLLANDTAVTADASRAQTFGLLSRSEAANSRANNFSPAWATFFNYASSTAEKWMCSQVMSFGNVSADADMFFGSFSGRWRLQVPIRALTLFPQFGPNLVSGSIISLYGVL